MPFRRKILYFFVVVTDTLFFIRLMGKGRSLLVVTRTLIQTKHILPYTSSSFMTIHLATSAYRCAETHTCIHILLNDKLKGWVIWCGHKNSHKGLCIALKKHTEKSTNKQKFHSSSRCHLHSNTASFSTVVYLYLPKVLNTCAHIHTQA